MREAARVGVETPRTWPLVGRSAELEQIASAIGRADQSGVVLAGPSGVGKTRLATESLAIAERIGFTTARAVASRAASTIPLGAFAPVLPHPGRETGVRYDALQSAVSWLSAQTEERPFMLLVDDAQLLDDASATVLHHLATESPVFVVVTLRSGEPVPDPVAALWKDDLALRVDVGPLRRPDVERLLTDVLGGPVDGATLADLWWSSEGNPLYLRELVAGTLEAGFLTDRDGVWRLRGQLTASPRLIEIVEARLDDLASGERAALEVVAFGEPLPLGVLASIAEESDVESLERRGLLAVETVGRRRRLVRVAHPVHADVVRERTPALRAMAVQRRLAETVAAGGPPGSEDAGADPLRVAMWTLESEGPVDPGLMTEAARRALLAHDHVLAERLAGVAIEEGGGEGVDAHQLLGEALYRQGRHEEAVSLLSAVVDQARSDAQRALIALTLAEALFNGLGRSAQADATLLEMEAAVSDPGWRAEGAALRAAYALLGGRPAAALEAVAPLLDPAHPRAFVVASTVAGPALAVTGKCDAAIEIADRAFAAHVDLGSRELLVHPGIHLVARALALGEAGRLEEARSTARAGYDGSVAERSAEGQAWFALILARAVWLSDLPEALRWFREAAGVFTGMGYGGHRRWCLAGAAYVAALRGHAPLARSLLDEIPALPSEHFGMMLSDVERAVAWVEVVEGAVPAAIKRLEEAATIAADAGCPALQVAALHDMARLGRADDAVPRVGGAAAEVDGPLAAARAEHTVALSAGDPAAVEAAAGSFEAMGAAILAAEGLAQASALWRRRNEGRAAQRCSQQAATLAERAGGLATPAMRLGGDAAVLTPRELEVATLASRGLTNKEIAGRLFLSVRTIGNHLQRAYEKLGVSGRDDLVEVLDGRPAPPIE